MSKTAMFKYTSLARDQDFDAAILLAELEDLPLRTYPTVNVFSHGSDDAAQQQGNSPYTSTPDLREGHIRLIQLGVDVPTGNIHCTTRIFPLHGRPSYTALSYAWGPLRAFDSRCKILLDGRKLLLHKGLWNFLSMGTSLRHLLEVTQHLCCTDPRDRVYALISAATIGHEGIPTDYTISTSNLIFFVLFNMCMIHPPTSCDEANARLRAIGIAFGVDLGFSIVDNVDPPVLNSGGQVTRARLYVNHSFDRERVLPSLAISMSHQP